MLSSLWLLALIIVLLIIASAFFSSAETALTAASDARMRQLASKGNERARTVEALRADREGLIGSILIGNNAVNVLGSALATSIAISLFGEGGLVWATIAMTVLLVVFAEVMPKYLNMLSQNNQNPFDMDSKIDARKTSKNIKKHAIKSHKGLKTSETVRNV